MTDDQKAEYKDIMAMADRLHSRIVALQNGVSQDTDPTWDRLEEANSAMAEVTYQLEGRGGVYD